jgi:hypothetical protein
MSEHEEQMKKVFDEVRYDDKPDARHRDALENRLLGVLAGAGRQPSAKAEIWRTIMTSRMTKVAAVFAIIAAVAVYMLISGTSANQSSIQILANAAAAEGALFGGTGVVHIVSEMTLYPSGPDTAKLLSELESAPTQDKNVAFMKSWLSQQWVPLYSLGADGKMVWHRLQIAGPDENPVKITDAVWYESMSGRFVRVLKAGDRVLFANAYDGHAIYLAERDASGKLAVNRTAVSGNFKVPANPADFMGIAAGVKGSFSTDHFPPIQKVTTERLADGTQVRVYKLGFVDFEGKLDTYFLFKTNIETDIMSEIECVAGGKTTRIQRRIAAETMEKPETAWDLSGLSTDAQAQNEVNVRTDKGAHTVTVAQMAREAAYPIYIFETQPSWVTKMKIFDLPDETNPAARMFAAAYKSTDGRDVVLTQGEAFNRYFGAMLKEIEKHNEQIHWKYESANGFKVMHQNDTTTEMWWTEVALKSSGFTASANRVGYILMSPAKDFCVLAINGPVSDEELHGMIDSLIPADKYVPESDQP